MAQRSAMSPPPQGMPAPIGHANPQQPVMNQAGLLTQTGFHNAALGGRCGFMYGEQFALPSPMGSADFMTTVQGGSATVAAVQLPGKDHLPMG